MFGLILERLNLSFLLFLKHYLCVGDQFLGIVVSLVIVSIWFRLVPYIPSFVILPKILLDHSSLICFRFLLHLTIYLLNLLLVSSALLLDIFGCQQ